MTREALMVGLLVFSLSSCSTLDPGMATIEAAVTPTTIGHAGQVEADDLAEAMLRAGFSRPFILKNGGAIRNALATAGGAQIRDGESVEAIFAVHLETLYVTSRRRGTFIQALGEAGARQSEAL
ncbi:MAG: hypothetical protein ACQETO_09435 [Pseudomonadota bacterium]